MKSPLLTIEKLQDDPEVGQAREVHHAAAEALTALITERQQLAPPVGQNLVPSLRLLELDARIERAQVAGEAAKVRVEAAEGAARARIVAAARPEEHTRRRRILELTERLEREVTEDRRHQEDLAARVGLAPGPYPLPQLLALGAALEQLRRLLAPPPADARPAEPMIRFTARCQDRENLTYRYPGDLARAASFPPESLRDLLKRGLAVEA